MKHSPVHCLARACAVVACLVLAACGGGDGPAGAGPGPSADHSSAAATGGKKPASIVAAARAGVRRIELQWNDDGKSTYRAYVSRSAGCNPLDPATCDELSVVDSARSPAASRPMQGRRATG